MRAFTILEKALENPDLSSKLENELKTLFFRNHDTVSGRELIDAVYSLAGFRREETNA
jgi:hypothetical protein